MMTEVPEVGMQEDAALVRSGYAAFSSGDMDTLKGLFTEDAVWHSGGSGRMAGTKQGRDAIMAFFGDLYSLSDGTVRVTLEDVVAGENHTVGIQRNHAERNGKTMDQRAVVVFRLTGGKVSEVHEFLEDTAKADSFWS